MNLVVFSSRLKNSRERNRMTQSDLAKILGRSVQTISNWENQINLPSLETLDMLCDALNVSSDYLMGREKLESLPVGDLNEDIVFDLKSLVEHIRNK